MVFSWYLYPCRSEGYDALMLFYFFAICDSAPVPFAGSKGTKKASCLYHADRHGFTRSRRGKPKNSS